MHQSPFVFLLKFKRQSLNVWNHHASEPLKRESGAASYSVQVDIVQSFIHYCPTDLHSIPEIEN